VAIIDALFVMRNIQAKHPLKAVKSIYSNSEIDLTQDISFQIFCLRFVSCPAVVCSIIRPVFGLLLVSDGYIF